MSNLLPFELKKDIKKERKVRLWSTFFLYTAFVTTSIFALLVPSYILTRSELSTEVKRAEDLKKEDNPLTLDEKKVIFQVNARTQALKVDDSLVYTRDIIEPVLAVVPPDVTLNIFNIDEKVDTGLTEVSFEGTAPTREKLLAFTDLLKEIPKVESTDIPVSNYVKGTNLTFTVLVRFKNGKPVPVKTPPPGTPPQAQPRSL